CPGKKGGIGKGSGSTPTDASRAEIVRPPTREEPERGPIGCGARSSRSLDKQERPSECSGSHGRDGCRGRILRRNSAVAPSGGVLLSHALRHAEGPGVLDELPHLVCVDRREPHVRPVVAHVSLAWQRELLGLGL